VIKMGRKEEERMKYNLLFRVPELFPKLERKERKTNDFTNVIIVV
jgi:hypothetical protein